MEELGKHLGDDAQILFGTAVDPKMGDAMSVTILSSISIGEEVSGAAQPSAAVTATAARPAKTLEAAAHRAPAGNGSSPAHHSDENNIAEPAESFEAEPDFEEALAENRSEPVDEEAESMAEPQVSHSAAAPSSKPVKTVPAPEPALTAAKREERQETLQFEPVTRGRFEKSEPTIVDGQDLDVPTWLRRNVRVK
jgi:cell division protein FtsZ